jgi:hypothetical protein
MHLELTPGFDCFQKYFFIPSSVRQSGNTTAMQYASSDALGSLAIKTGTYAVGL